MTAGHLKKQESKLVSRPRPQRPQSNVTWTRVQSLPNKMLQPQVVPTKGGVVYVGGGLGNSCMLSLCAFAYDVASDTWRMLPWTPTTLFGMCIFEDSVTTIGGVGENGITGNVYRLNEAEKKWEASLPAMPTGRFSLSVFSTDSALVACGGGVWHDGDATPTPCSVVEVYRRETKSWQLASALPRPCAAMSSSAIGTTCYLLGDTDSEDRVGPMYADIAEITDSSGKGTSNPNDSNKNSDIAEITGSREDTSNPNHSKSSAKSMALDSSNGPLELRWHHLPPPPVANTSIVATRSYLLAIGGHVNEETVESVHLYVKESQQWWQLAAGDLPQGLEGCGLAVLDPPGRVMVVGGEDSAGMFTDSVFIGNLL